MIAERIEAMACREAIFLHTAFTIRSNPLKKRCLVCDLKQYFALDPALVELAGAASRKRLHRIEPLALPRNFHRLRERLAKSLLQFRPVRTLSLRRAIAAAADRKTTKQGQTQHSA